MHIADLTRRWRGGKDGFEAAVSEVPLESANTRYTGVIYRIAESSMLGTYIDFPGHIRETDNGVDAGNFPVRELYRAPASVIRLDRDHGPVSGAELEAAFGGKVHTPVLVINALGARDETELPFRIVYLDHSALDWIIACGVRYLISDVYESQALHGVFLKLFQAGVTTICCPANLAALHCGEVKITCLFLPLAGVTQIPCRLIAEQEE